MRNDRLHFSKIKPSVQNLSACSMGIEKYALLGKISPRLGYPKHAVRGTIWMQTGIR